MKQILKTWWPFYKQQVSDPAGKANKTPIGCIVVLVACMSFIIAWMCWLSYISFLEN